MTFMVPEPVTPSIVTLLLGKERRSLAAGSHVPISWETLVSQGVTPEEVLSADARHVMAFVRDSRAQPVTWEHLRALDPELAIADLLSSHFGKTMTPECAAMFGLTTAEISARDVGLAGWSHDRWREVFGAVPLLQGEASTQFCLKLTL